MEAGFNRHLVKPASPEVIERVMMELLPAEGGTATPTLLNAGRGANA